MTKKEKEGESNIYSLEKLLSFPIKGNNNNNNNNKKKTKHLVACNCWVCQILDSSTTTSVTKTVDDDKTDKTDTTTTTATKRYEPYNIVSEIGDSIFYDPLVSNLNDKVLNRQQIYIAEDKIIQTVQQDEDKLTKHFNGVNFNKIESR
jgi:hypothetical protein